MKALSLDEFIKELKQLPGIKIEGGFIKGIRLLTPSEQQERKGNAKVIRQIICKACGSDERNCGTNCMMMKNRAHWEIASRLPVGVKLFQPD